MNRLVLLIARREIVARVQQKGYRIGVGVALLVVIAACVIPSFFKSSNSATSYDIGIAAPPAGLASALTDAGTAAHLTVRLHPTDAATARQKVHDGDWDAAVVNGQVVAQHSTDAAVVLVERAYAATETDRQLRAAGLSAAQVAHALTVRPLPVVTTSAAQNGQRRAIGTIAIVALFSQLVTFCTWVAMGVVEEKSSRVVELILSSVRPVQLLTGKLLGIGALALAQVALLGVTALVAAHAASTLTLPASAIGTVIVSVIGFVFGFAFFSGLSAGLGATVSRQEEVSGVIAPVTILLTACYLVSFSVASDTGSTLSRVLSMVPPISAIAMPARIAGGGVPVTDLIIAIVLIAVVSVGIVAVSARIYRASILHTGSRVSLRRAWRGEAVADVA